MGAANAATAMHLVTPPRGRRGNPQACPADGSAARYRREFPFLIALARTPEASGRERKGEVDGHRGT